MSQNAELLAAVLPRLTPDVLEDVLHDAIALGRQKANTPIRTETLLSIYVALLADPRGLERGPATAAARG